MGETDVWITTSLQDSVIHRAWGAEQGTTQPITGAKKVAWVCWARCSASHTKRCFTNAPL